MGDPTPDRFLAVLGLEPAVFLRLWRVPARRPRLQSLQPTPNQAEVIRDVLGIRKRKDLSPETLSVSPELLD